MSGAQLGRWSALAVFLVGIAYAIALTAGFAVHGLAEPIVDPILAVMELLTVLSVFLGVALLFAAPVFADAGRERNVRRAMTVTGLQCIAGVVGPAVGNMRLQLVGVLGYAVALPVVCLMAAGVFRQHSRTSPPDICCDDRA